MLVAFQESFFFKRSLPYTQRFSQSHGLLLHHRSRSLVTEDSRCPKKPLLRRNTKVNASIGKAGSRGNGKSSDEMDIWHHFLRKRDWSNKDCKSQIVFGEVCGVMSRFPKSWSELVEQACVATLRAIEEGNVRVLLDLRQDEMVCVGERGRILEKVPQAEEDSEEAGKVDPSEARNLAAATSVCAILAKRLAGEDSSKRVMVYFNTRDEVNKGRAIMGASSNAKIRLGVLGEGSKYPSWEDLSILVSPTNRKGNPGRIEAVEMIHYHRRWEDHSKPVILLNPDLVALSPLANCGKRPRIPTFIADYLPCYCINSAAFSSPTITGAVLRCFPRKWEMYLHNPRHGKGFQLVGQRESKPIYKDLMREFLWRFESDKRAS